MYDLQRDPDENENLILAGEFEAKRDALHDRLLAWMNETIDPFRGYCWERRPWRKNARALTWKYTGMVRPVRCEASDPTPLDYETGLAAPPAGRPS